MSHAVVRIAGSVKIGAAIFVLALIFRLLMLLWFPLPNMEYVDESEYFALGQNLRFHQTFSFGAPHLWGQHGELNAPGPFVPTAARPPLYPLLIAILWWGDAPPYLSLALAQVVLGSLVALLVYLVALRALGLPVAIVAGLGMALAPESASYVTIALTETLYTFLLIGFVWLWGKQRGFLAGLLLGAAALVRSNAIVLVPLIGLMGLVWGFNRTVHLRIALAALLVILPWVARNHATQHEFTPIATYGWGSVLFYSTVDVPYYSGNPFTVWLADKEAQAIYAGALTLECCGAPPSSRRIGTNSKGPHRLPLESSDGISKKLPRSRRLVHADNSAAEDRCEEHVLGRERDLRHTVRLGLVFGPQGVATNVFHRSGATRFCGHAVCGRGQPTLQHSAGASHAGLRCPGCLPCLDACGEGYW